MANTLYQNLTNVNATQSVTAVIQAFDNVIGNWLIFGILLGLLVVLVTALYNWNPDLLENLNHGLMVINMIGFLLFLIKIDGVRLFLFERWAIFLTIHGLVIIAKKLHE